MVTKQLFYLLFIFFAVLGTLLVCLRGKEYFAMKPEPESVGAGCFWPLGAGAARKKIPGAGAGAGAAWGKNQDPEPLEKKSQEPEPEPLKNFPAPQL